MANNPFFGGGPFHNSTSPFEQAFQDEEVMKAMAEANQQANPMSAPPPPQQAQPVYQPPQQGGLPGQQQVRDFMNSPGAAMAYSALSNISANQPNSPMQRTDPIAAYQKGVAQQSALKQREQTIKLREAQEARLQGAEARAANPFYDYEMAKEKGVIPDEMTFAEFSQLGYRGQSATSNQKDLQTFMQLNPDATPEDIQKFFNESVRASTPYQLGGGGIGLYNPGSGYGTTLVQPEDATRREGDLAGTKEGAVQGEKTRADQVRAGLTGASQARTGYQTATEMLNVTDDWIERFSGANPPDTGMVTKFMAEFLGIGSEEIGDLSAESIKSGLTNLGLANLAPVTEQEFANVLRLWASLGSSPEMNLGALRNARRRTERLMEMIKEDAIYNAGLVEEYGTEGQRGAFLRANPFVRDLMTEPTTDDDDPEIP